MTRTAVLALDGPREKLQAKGVTALSELELLQALIGSGTQQANAASIAKEISKLLKQFGADITFGQLEKVVGLGTARVSKILAAIELSRRYLLSADAPIVNSVADVATIVKDIANKNQEYFVCLTLDGANRLLASRIVTIGTLTASLVHPREVFADVIANHAASIIVAHNHPSGSLTPSTADLEITQRLVRSGELLGIKLIDHIIVSKRGHATIKTAY